MLVHHFMGQSPPQQRVLPYNGPSTSAASPTELWATSLFLPYYGLKPPSAASPTLLGPSLSAASPTMDQSSPQELVLP